MELSLLAPLQRRHGVFEEIHCLLNQGVAFAVSLLNGFIAHLFLLLRPILVQQFLQVGVEVVDYLFLDGEGLQAWVFRVHVDESQK